MFKFLYKKLFKHKQQENLEMILADLNLSIKNVQTDFETSLINNEKLIELCEEKTNNEKLIKSIYDISLTLIKHNNINTALLETLKILVNINCSEMAFIFKNNFDDNLTEKKFVWSNSNIKDTPMDIFNLDDYPIWKNKLSQNSYVYGTKDNYCQKKINNTLQLLNINSILILPINIDKTWWGSLILSHTDIITWNIPEIEILRSICNMIGMNIKRYQTQYNGGCVCSNPVNFLETSYT